jgi:hypothetical protein
MSLVTAGPPASPSRKEPSGISVQTVVELLNSINRHLTRQCVEPSLVKQIFAQVFHLINSRLVNNLLLRKDMCHLFKGMQVRYNLSKLEEWARDNKLEPIVQHLLEAIQISQLLQMEKSTTDDVGKIFELCTNLNSLQMQKILQMYTPGEHEARVPVCGHISCAPTTTILAFFPPAARSVHPLLVRSAQCWFAPPTARSVRLLLDRSFRSFISFHWLWFAQASVIRAVVSRGKTVEASQLMMDTSRMLPVKFPFEPNAPNFAELAIPPQLRLSAYITLL